jgi:PilZ domain-containing protein
MTQQNNSSSAYSTALRESAEPMVAATAPTREGPLEVDAGGPPRIFQGAEKRRSPRYNCEGRIDLSEVGCDAHTWADFTDISLHGCYVEAQATYPVGTSLRMKLEINHLKIETTGTVRVNYPYVGMGISFGEMSEENRSQLKQLLATISRRVIVMGPGATSSSPARGAMEPIPLIADPAAAMQSLIDFFETRHTLTRDDFLGILRESQQGRAKP